MSESKKLDPLKEALLEDILAMTDKELREELKELKLNPDDLVRTFNTALDKATAAATRRMYEEAKSKLRVAENTPPPIQVSIPRARSQLERLVASGSPVLMAARKGTPLDKLPDAEIESLAKDLLELGVLKPEDLA